MPWFQDKLNPFNE